MGPKGSVWINLLVGIWLIIAPFALAIGGVNSVWATNDVILGILLIAFSWWMLAAIAPPTGAAWFEILCGIWLIVAPFVLRYSDVLHARWNDVVCGIIAIIVAAVASWATTHRPTLA
jgi:hypothetical protein